jgi:hypothetical protein
VLSDVAPAMMRFPDADGVIGPALTVVDGPTFAPPAVVSSAHEPDHSLIWNSPPPELGAFGHVTVTVVAPPVAERQYQISTVPKPPEEL